MTDTQKLVSLIDAKIYLKINPANKKRDREIDSLIDDVTADIQAYLDRNLFTDTYEEYFDIKDYQDVINLREVPVQSVAFVCDYGSALIEGTNYEIDTNR